MPAGSGNKGMFMLASIPIGFGHGTEKMTGGGAHENGIKE